MPFRGLWNLLTADGPVRLASAALFLALASAVPVLAVLAARRVLRGG